MFAMLAGPWPRVTADGTRLDALEAGLRDGRVRAADVEAAVERLVGEAVAAQVEAGLGLVTDGGVRWADPGRALLHAIRTGDVGPDGLLVRAWTTAARLVNTPVAAAITGPWTLAVTEVGGRGDASVVAGRAGELSDHLAAELEALAAAGCPLVIVDEPASIAIRTDERARGGFASAQRRLLVRAPGLHAMLAVTGGSAAAAGPGTIFAAPYASFLFDLIAGPDNWSLVRAAPPDGGIVCAALAAGGGREELDQAPQLVWAARYAASAGGRGLARVGIANATPLSGLAPDAARRALAALARAATLAALPVADAVDAGLDPRTITTGPARGPAPGATPNHKRPSGEVQP